MNDQDDISGVRKAIPVIQDEGNGLFAKLENKNVSDVSLTNSDLSVKTQITGDLLVRLVYLLQILPIQMLRQMQYLKLLMKRDIQFTER